MANNILLAEKQFMITSERWQLLEKERLEILRKRELIEHRIDLRYHSEEGLEHHKSDYYKRLLKKVEDNMERSKIRNKQLVNKADDLLSNISNTNTLVKSKVKLEVAKKQFLQSFQNRVKEHEEIGRQEKLKQIRKTEEEIESERRKLRESTLEWEREKKVNYDLQEKIKELIITKEQSKKEAIEREAERKAILEGERKVQRVVEQTSVDASRRYLEKQEKRTLETVEGKDLQYKGLVEEVYDGKIGIAAREKFISSSNLTVESSSNKPIVGKPTATTPVVDELYYNDGYSSIEEKQNANSFAKFKEWQKKQALEKKKQPTEVLQPPPKRNIQQYPPPQRTVLPQEEEDVTMNEPSIDNDSLLGLSRVQTTQVLNKDLLDDSIGSIEDKESESDDITTSFLESIKKPNLVSALEESNKTTVVHSVSPTQLKQGNFVKIQSKSIIATTSPKNQSNPLPASNNCTTPTPINNSSTSSAAAATPTTKFTPIIAAAESNKEPTTKNEQEATKENDSKKNKLKSFFSAFKFSGKKKEEEKAEETESSSENDTTPQDRESDNMVQEKSKKMNETKLVSTLQCYLQDIEQHIKEQKEKYNKMSLNFKLENSQELLPYLSCPKLTGKVRVQNIEATKKDIDLNMKCVACLDILQYLPTPMVTTDLIEECSHTTNDVDIDDLSKYLNKTAIEAWKLTITHVSNLSKLEPKWKEQLLTKFSETICKTLPHQQKTDAKSTIKSLLKTMVSSYIKQTNPSSTDQTPNTSKYSAEQQAKVITTKSSNILDDDSEEENIFEKTRQQATTRPTSSAPSKFKKPTRLITSVSAFNPTVFAKLNKNIMNEDTSDSDIDNIIARPRNISSATAVEGTSKPITTIQGTTNFDDDDDTDF